jgi:Leucine-rich repeat (LRR) protein
MSVLIKYFMFKRNYFEEFNGENIIDFLFDENVLTLYVGLHVYDYFSISISNPTRRDNIFILSKEKIIKHMKRETMYIFFLNSNRMKNNINQSEGTFHSCTFNNLTFVNELTIYIKDVFVIRREWFSKLVNLRRLKFRFSNIYNIEDNSFRYLLKLECLSLAYNNIKTLKSNTLTGLINLKDLNISYCGMGDIEENVFEKLDKIESICLNDNNFETIKTHFFNEPALKHLNKLDLSACNIRHIQPGSFQNLFSLRELHLSRNHFEIVKDNFFVGLHNLDYLNLSFCRIKVLESNVFNDLTCLTLLRFESNLIEHLDPMSSLTKLRKLKKLYLNSCLISNIDAKTFKEMSFLHYIDLSNNKINIHASQLANMGLNENLQISNNVLFLDSKKS